MGNSGALLTCLTCSAASPLSSGQASRTTAEKAELSPVSTERYTVPKSIAAKRQSLSSAQQKIANEILGNNLIIDGDFSYTNSYGATLADDSEEYISVNDVIGTYIWDYYGMLSTNNGWNTSYVRITADSSRINGILIYNMPYSDLYIEGTIDPINKTISVDSQDLFYNTHYNKMVKLVFEKYVVEEDGALTLVDTLDTITGVINKDGVIIWDQDLSFAIRIDDGYFSHTWKNVFTKFETFEYNANEWDEMGTAKFRDGWLNPYLIWKVQGMANYGIEDYPVWDVQILKNKENPSTFLLVDPYAAIGYSGGYIYIDATNPDCVLVKPNIPTGYWFEDTDANYNYVREDVSVFNKEGKMYFYEKYNYDEIIEALGNDISTFKDSVITVSNLFFGVDTDPLGEYRWTNNGEFLTYYPAQIILPGAGGENPDPINPDPINPDPVDPDPINPDPIDPNVQLGDNLIIDGDFSLSEEKYSFGYPDGHPIGYTISEYWEISGNEWNSRADIKEFEGVDIAPDVRGDLEKYLSMRLYDYNSWMTGTCSQYIGVEENAKYRFSYIWQAVVESVRGRGEMNSEYFEQDPVSLWVKIYPVNHVEGDIIIEAPIYSRVIDWKQGDEYFTTEWAKSIADITIPSGFNYIKVEIGVSGNSGNEDQGGAGINIVAMNVSGLELRKILGENPDPINPDPVNPDPVDPDPVDPDPVDPDHVKLTLIHSGEMNVDVPVARGKKATVAFNHDSYWELEHLIFNGEEVTHHMTDNSYTTPELNADATLESTLRYAGDLTVGPSTGIVELDGSNVAVSVNGNKVTITGLNEGDEIVVYNLMGHILNSHVATIDTESITLGSGVYIIRINNKAVKLSI